MIRVRIHGDSATLDLFEHHLVITRSALFGDAVGDELFVPLSSIAAIQLSRPSFGKKGRLVLRLAGSAAQKAGTISDPYTIFFDKYQVKHCETVVEAVRAAIALPSLQQLALAAQQGRASQTILHERGPTQTSHAAVIPASTLDEQGQDASEYTDHYGSSSGGRGLNHQEGPAGEGIVQTLPFKDGWWSSMPLLGKVIVVVLGCVLLLTFCSSVPNDQSGDTAATSAEPAIPTLAELLDQGDSRACSHPDTLRTLHEIVVPDTLSASDLGITQQELDEVKGLARTDVDTISMSGLKADIHEVTCSGVMRIANDGDDNVEITYKVRPGAGQDGQFIVWLKEVREASTAVVSRALQEVRNKQARSERVATSKDQVPAAQEPTPRAHPAEQPAQPSENDLYAPH